MRAAAKALNFDLQAVSMATLAAFQSRFYFADEVSCARRHPEISLLRICWHVFALKTLHLGHCDDQNPKIQF